MLNEKRMKALIVVSLFVIEAFVWTFNDPGGAWSLGFSGTPDGSPGIISGEGNGSEGQNGNGNEGAVPGDEPGDQEAPGSGTDSSGNAEQPDSSNAEGTPGSEGPDQNSGSINPGEGITPMTAEEANAAGILILVNKTHPIDRDYKPDDLVKIKYYAADRSEAGRYMRAEAADAFHQLVEKAAAEGVELKMTTAYRSYDFQKTLFDNYVKREGEAAANRYSARPGQSEHQTGLSVDVSSPSVGYQLTGKYANTTEGKWLAEHAHEFGFIIRFPQGKEDITGYLYEPWHIRYVGKTTAKEIYESGVTLEEYLQN